MRHTELICHNCVYRVKGSRGYICEKTGMHLYWNMKTCEKHVETAKSYWKDQRDTPK